MANGVMTVSGNATTIHHNNTEGYSYGLHTEDSSSSIHLVSPLTKEMISMNNDGGQEYGGDGTIKSVDKDGKVLEVLYDGEEVHEDEPEWL